MIYVVLGMHKSGTTLVSQILHSSGIKMGDFDANVSYDRGNKYERAESLALDLDILGTESYDVLNVNASDIPKLNESQKENMLALIAKCENEHEDWGLKDPRMCLTYHLWAEHLPPHRLIVVYRDAAEIWPRFKWRGKRGLAINLSRAYAYQKRWIEHNTAILKVLQESACERIVLGYGDLMQGDSELERLRAFVGHDLVDHRKPGLYRSRSRSDFFLNLASWWLEKREGLHTRDALQKLQDLRAVETAVTTKQTQEPENEANQG